MITLVNPADSAKWDLILPIKGGSEGKSRLGPQPHSLAQKFAERTLAALLSCGEVSRIIIVTADEYWTRLTGGRILVVADPGAGLNPAIRTARDQFPGKELLAAIPSDLPVLNPRDLAEVLVSARQHPRAFVRDKDGAGTTLLTARKSEDLIPLYGGGSAAAHLASGAFELAAPHSVRFDVDTIEDLEKIKL